MCAKFEAGKSYKTLDGDLITVVSRKGRRVRYRAGTSSASATSPPFRSIASASAT